MIFTKIAADLDSNPKVREAGRDGREVFLFALRKNAAHDFNGCVPSSYFKPKYLADQLMMDEVTAGHGLSRSVTAGLLTATDDGYVISGWDDEWAKRPLTDAERKRRSRAKTSNPESLPIGSSVGHEMSRPESDSHACHALDKSRVDKKKEVSAPPDECLALADSLRDFVLTQQPTNALGKKPWPPIRDKWAREFDLAVRRDHRTVDAIATMLTWVFTAQTGDAQFEVESPSALRKKFDKIEKRMARPTTSTPRWQTTNTEIRVVKRLGETETSP